MAAKKCAREECGKTVYPIEELNCLDKTWHKQCFKCSSCGMTLSMKNYKGYEKKPYCEAHYPKTVASVVADTPEMRRLAENTKLQSQVKYHEAYEKMKGTKMEIADDPELMRHLQNTKAQSLVQYHGEVERKNQQEQNRPKAELTNDVPSSTSTTFSSTATYTPVDENVYVSSSSSNNGNTYNIQSTSFPHSNTSQKPSQDCSPYTQRLASQTTVVYSSDNGGRVPTEQRQVGSIADYDPLNGDWGTSAASKNAEKLASAASQRQQAATVASEAQQKQTSATQKTSSSTTKESGAKASQQPTPAAARAQARIQTGFTVKAMYDYTAADKDERTLQWGMLPANYVEKVNTPTGMFKLN